MKSKMKLFAKIVNDLKSLIFVTIISDFDFVLGLDTSLIFVNYKILFYSSSLSITIISLTTFKEQNIVVLFTLKVNILFLFFCFFRKNFLYYLPHYFYQFQQCQVFFHSFQVVPPRSTPLHVTVGYIVANIFVLLENLAMFHYHWMTNFGFRSHWPIQWHLITTFLKEKSQCH